MGTHPIFESDFDCLTERNSLKIAVKMSKVANVGKLAGHTLFISGASRGIGLEVAKKAAADGANIVVAAKTAKAHPKLPGTIYTAADEIERLAVKPSHWLLTFVTKKMSRTLLPLLSKNSVALTFVLIMPVQFRSLGHLILQ